MLMPRYSEQDNHSDNSFVVKPGPPSHTTVAAHTKMRLLSKVEQNMRQNQQNPGQNQSINKLINTAATGNGLVGDVDELLTPMRIKADNGDRDYSPGNGNKDSHTRPERNLWSRAEMLEMLNIMQQMNALEQLNDRNVKSEHVFRQIEDVMRSKGYVKKSSIQIWTKWKFLKSTYNTTTRHGNGIPKVVPEEVYRVLCRMLSEHSSGNNSGNGSGSSINIGIGSECGNSMDSSNAELRKTIADSEDVKEELGVEHPIFGFRLGLVKPEPLDTGYETSLNQGNSSEQEIEAVDFVHSSDSIPAQTLEHTPFMVTVKHEPEMDLGMDGTNTPPPTAPTSPSPPPIVMEQRDNGERSNLYQTQTLSTSMPPLRVAAFASDARRVNSTPTHGVLQIERSGNLLNKSSTGASLPGKGNRTMPLQSTSSINFVHPTSKLMLPRKQLPLRIPKEISLQPASTRPLKAVPIRETGYSLRPDRMIPDLEQSISPPQSPSPPMHMHSAPKFNIPYASTSRQAQQLNEQLHPLRKRRLNFSQQSSPVPVKLQRSSAPYEHKHQGNMRKHDVMSADEQRNKMIAEEAQRRKQQQEEVFKKELCDLASAMRDAQKEMLEDFFQRQKQLARREHEFQLRQDNLVMSALRKQTDALLQSARQLLKSEEKDVCPSTKPEKQQQQQRETETNTSNKLVEHENREHQESVLEQDQEMEDYDEDGTQCSEEGNQSEAAMVMSSLALSEDASNHSCIPNDRQLS